MAVLFEMDEECLEWIKSRPPAIQALIQLIPPNRLYRLKTTGSRCTLFSYNEDGTVTVIIDGTWDVVLFPRQVFGINPQDLEECDLPPADHMRGILLDGKQTLEYINSMRKLNGLGPLSGETLQ